MSRLLLNPVVLVSPHSEGYVAYDTATNRLHQLNPTAALLVELCDGSRTAEEVLVLAAPLLPPDSAGAVRAWLENAVEEEVLVQREEAELQTVQELAAEDLAELADRLRENGQVQAAYLCQQRASELRPEDGDWLRSLGELSHIVGKREEARRAYEALLRRQPDDAEILHLLTSLRDDDAPPRAPDDCIRQLYQRFAAFYEDNMCDELGYEGPMHLSDVIERMLEQRRELTILDLGCGTGLAGMAVAERAKRLVGVDLSPEMLEQAKQRGLYDELHVAEITDWLSRHDERFDLVIACDTLIYFGDLTRVMKLAAEHLNDEGAFAFSVERSDSDDFRLTDNGRYVHHPRHIQAAAEAAGMRVDAQQAAFLRMEYGEEVTGLYTGMRFDPTSSC